MATDTIQDGCEQRKLNSPIMCEKVSPREELILKSLLKSDKEGLIPLLDR